MKYQILLILPLLIQLAVGAREGLGYVISFTLAARDVPPADPISAPDPFVKLWHYRQGLGSSYLPRMLQLVRFGTSSAVENDANPEWPEVFQFWYQPKGGQKWHFEVRDHDPLAPDDILGTAEIEVDDYMRHEGDFHAPLSRGGHLIIRKAQTIGFRIKANNLPAEDNMFLPSDPYVRIYKWDPRRPDHKTLLGETLVLENSPNPSWPTTFEIPYIPHQNLILKFYDHDTFTSDDYLGEAVIPVESIVRSSGVPLTVRLARSNGLASVTVELAYLWD